MCDGLGTRAPAEGNQSAMRRKVYEGLYGLDEGYRLVQRSLQMLERHPALRVKEISRLRALNYLRCSLRPPLPNHLHRFDPAQCSPRRR